MRQKLSLDRSQANTSNTGGHNCYSALQIHRQIQNGMVTADGDTHVHKVIMRMHSRVKVAV